MLIKIWLLPKIVNCNLKKLFTILLAGDCHCPEANPRAKVAGSDTEFWL